MLGMPSIEIEFEFDMVFCFGIRLAPYAIFFSTRICLHHIARPVESDRPINIVFVCPFFRSQFMNVWPLGIDLCNLRKDPGKIYLIKTMWNK